MTTAPAGNARTQSPATNLFAARAQQEEQSRRVPINQLAQSSAQSSASTQLHAPLMPGAAAWQPAAGTAVPSQLPSQPQPVVQPNPYAPVGVAPYPQSQNPFL